MSNPGSDAGAAGEAARAASASPSAPAAAPGPSVTPAGGSQAGAARIAVSGAAAAIQALVDRLRAGRCVLWAGAALDDQLGGRGFRAVVARLLDQLPPSSEVAEARALLGRRPFLVAGLVRRRLGDRFPEALAAACAGPEDLPVELRLLAELPFRAVITTGLSDLVPRAFAAPFARGGQPAPVRTPADAAALLGEAGRRRYLLRALGDPARVGSVVFSVPELQAALGPERLGAALRAVHRGRSILFLGLDPLVDIERVLGRVLGGDGPGGGDHLAVLAGLSGLERDELRASFGVQVVDEPDTLAFVRALRAAIGDTLEALPGDDDVDGWLGVLGADPDRADHRERLGRLEQRLAAAGEHERLVELHLGMAELEPDAAGRARRLHAVARLLERPLGEPAKALPALVAAWRQDPGEVAPAELERLAGAVPGGWLELAAEYAAAAPLLEGAARAALLARLGRVRLEQLGDAPGALAALDEALVIEPGRPLGEVSELRRAALRQAERWPELAAALAEAAAAATGPRRAALHLERVDLLERHLDDATGAVAAGREALAADPGSPAALSALELLFRRRAEWPELVAVLDDKARAAPPDEARELRLEAAAIVHAKLGDLPAAIARYQALREAGVGLPALRALVSLHQQAGHADQALDALADEAAATDDPAAAAALYHRLAAAWEDRAGGAARAAAFLEQLQALTPDDEEVLRRLERLYAALGRFEALVDAYRRHLALPGADRVALRAAIARVLERDLGDPVRAADAWEKVLVEAPDSDEAMTALTRLHAATGAWDRALALLDRRVERARDPEARARAHHEAGRIAADQLGDVKGAEARYHQALAASPSHVPAMTAMVELYRKSGEFLRAAKLLVEASSHTSNRLDRTRMLVEAGEIHASLDQPAVAIDLLQRALSVDPEHVEAGGRLADLLWGAGRYHEVVPVLEMLTRKEADRATTRARLIRLGKAAREVGQLERAGRAFLRAAEIDPLDVEAQREAGLVLFEEGRWAEAREAWKAVLAGGGEAISDEDRVALYYRMGECDRHLERLDRARNFYAKALELDPHHRPTILAMLDLEGGDPARTVAAKRALLATASDDEKVKLLAEIGELSQGKLGDPAGAVAAFREALAVRESRPLLYRTLEVLVEIKDWAGALEVLGRLTTLEPLPAVRAKVRFTGAMIHLEELGDPVAAARLLGEAWEDDPTPGRYGDKLEELLRRTGAWKELQRFYRGYLRTLRPDPDADTPEQRRERLRVWGAIADVSIDKLGEPGVGLSALEVAATLDRDNPHRREQLADLYLEAGPDHAERAIAAHQQLLKEQRERVASYRALRQLYLATRQPDKALAASYALVFLKQGAPEDLERVAQAQKRPLAPARRNLDEEMWTRLLLHPDEDRSLGQLFALVLPNLQLANGVRPETLGVTRRDLVPTTDERGFAKGLRYVAGALHVGMPHETYVKYDQREAVTVACTVDRGAPEACVIVGRPLLGDKRTERELVYELARRLSYFRPDRFLRFVLPQAAQLALVIDAAVALAAEADREKGSTAETPRLAQDLKRSLAPPALEQVQALGRRFRGAQGAGRGAGPGGAAAHPSSLEAATAWLEAAELTATRAAFLLVGDLETTARFVAAEPTAGPVSGPVAGRGPRERLKELLQFSVSEECFALRKHLGLL